MSREGTLGATLALAAGAVAVGLSPLFVRVVEVGPFASAFWRAALALPALALWAALERPPAPDRARRREATRWAALAGLAFAVDLAFWHLAILNTTLANATFVTCGLPVVFLALLGAALLGERLGPRELAVMALAATGAALLFGSSLRIDLDRLDGDAAGVGAALGFTFYVLALKRGGGAIGPGRAALVSTAVTAAALLPLQAVGHGFWPRSGADWRSLALLALLCQAFGQGAVVLSLRRLPAGYSAAVILIEPLTTVALGALLFAEAIGPLQAAGGGLTLAAVFMGRPRPRSGAPPPTSGGGGRPDAVVAHLRKGPAP